MVTPTGASGEAIGCGIANLENDILVLETIEINAASRGKGVGTEVLNALFTWGRQNGASVLTGDFKPEPWSARKARDFYEINGVDITADGKLFKSLL